MAFIKYLKQDEIPEKNRVKDLRDNGFDDIGIHDMCTIVSYFNFVNRIANGLGVELESN